MTYLEAYRQCKTVEAIKVMAHKDIKVAILMGNNLDRIRAIQDAMNQAIAEREEDDTAD